MANHSNGQNTQANQTVTGNASMVTPAEQARAKADSEVTAAKATFNGQPIDDIKFEQVDEFTHLPTTGTRERIVNLETEIERLKELGEAIVKPILTLFGKVAYTSVSETLEASGEDTDKEMSLKVKAAPRLRDTMEGMIVLLSQGYGDKSFDSENFKKQGKAVKQRDVSGKGEGVWFNAKIGVIADTDEGLIHKTVELIRNAGRFAYQGNVRKATGLCAHIAEIRGLDINTVKTAIDGRVIGCQIFDLNKDLVKLREKLTEERQAEGEAARAELRRIEIQHALEAEKNKAAKA